MSTEYSAPKAEAEQPKQAGTGKKDILKTMTAAGLTTKKVTPLKPVQPDSGLEKPVMSQIAEPVQTDDPDAKAAADIQNVIKQRDKSVRPMGIVDMAQAVDKVPDLQTFNDPGRWITVCKASSEAQGWMRSTKAMNVEALGCLVQVSSINKGYPSEAVVFVPGVSVRPNGAIVLS